MSEQSGNGAPERLALTHATVIDGTGAGPARDMTVLVEGGRITTVGRSSEVPVDEGVRTADLTGKYLIPGLIDAHVHSPALEEIAPPLYPLAGVTTVREMWGEPLHHEWRRKIDDGELLGPRWVIGSAMVDGTPSLWADDAGSVLLAGDEHAARQAVRRAEADGADFVKVYSRLSRGAYLAVADEARRLGIPFAGHCPDAVPVAEASGAGQRSIEHLHALLLSTASREQETEIRRGLAEVRLEPVPSSLDRYHRWFQQIHELEGQAVRSYDRERARSLFHRLAAEGTHVTPTLTVHHMLERPGELPSHAPEWTYLPRWMTAAWPDILEALIGGRTARQAELVRTAYAHRLRLVAELHRCGVPILAGTDTGTGYAVPGFALHDELNLLVDAGLTPMQALQSATRTPARFLGLGDRTGTVEQGRAADLLVLDADPLHDIRNTRKIDSVVLRGRLIGAAKRRRLLATVEKAAAAAPPPADTVISGGCGCSLHPRPHPRTRTRP
ncbi:amidohydrolase family protein [Streptomyces sp. NPDC050617]|uniref:amidohydrolase family protein n=1 Tax=Streptomyces sp. NPDC050617 TaxID=3154628 RepID=UPI0034274299